MKSLLKLAAILFTLAAALAVYLMDYDRFGPTHETFVDIPSGTGTAAIASRLQSAGVLRSRFIFEALRKLQGGTLKAGEYRFDHPLTPLEIYAHIARGDVYTIALTIPEGFNIFDIAQAAERAGLAPAPTFLAAARANTALIADLSPHAPSLEGFLFPDTYRFSRHAPPAQILAAMVRRFRQAAAQLHLSPGPDLPRTVILASLIEKEVAVPTERPLVAGVFTNRLALAMPLATDPSVAYAALLENRWRGTIYQSDLAAPSPYNTYRHPGLPPGPIANPGLAAPQAAMHPAPTSFLYFVAGAKGHSRFSVSLAEHAAQVQAYRQATAKPPALARPTPQR